ncbi:DUF3422 domain-containing protein [Rhizobium sp. SSA_523]|uniref:DUF3422 domain-containing protein n=1 Tax=Rhizobium sp. SSA_523 TaxID=2952477 RepID=UPI002090B40A|nr:DUF3422 family protein [Rhizobium sp. SSA_523]MCO5732044.1 DUF3422 family protein [Rhizobium sp. SSA_523]WKC22618.1 DUF3422 family protein [Rhizobium sp. SSA_523]
MAGHGFSFPPAPLRSRALGEIHSRPYTLIALPRVIFQLAFLTEGDAGRDRQILADLARGQGVAAPETDSNHHAMSWGGGTLRWERHTEFSTYFWDGPAPAGFGEDVPITPFGGSFEPPGPFISGVRVEIRPFNKDLADVIQHFDLTSLCQSMVADGKATVMTDFRQDGNGLTKFLIFDLGMTDSARGALVQRILDIETYRTLAMLGLPLAQALSPEIRKIETELGAVTERMKGQARQEADALLTEITGLAAELEAHAAASSYRFGASRAYGSIVQERIAMLGERAVAGSETLGGFLQKRLAPAMRTCQSVEERQINLSRKLARATALLRSWIDVDLQKFNTELLNSMNQRAQMQLRLQQTVEGLSVAAISYYVIGLVGHLAEFAHSAGLPVEPHVLSGASVPLVLLGVWWVVRRIRKRHADPQSGPH